MDLTGADFALQWPGELFIAEARALQSIRDPNAPRRMEFLLEEAFAGPAPRDAFKEATQRYDGFGDGSDVVKGLMAAAPNLTVEEDVRPYYPQRKAEGPYPVVSIEALRRTYVRLVADLNEKGYLDRVMPGTCVDDHDFVPVNKSDVLEERLGVADLWPLNRSEPTWQDETFFGLIEAFHDIVARPRFRTWHDYSGCGWHYSEFALEPARQLYRWRVNRLLARSPVTLRLAGRGEDAGRLVAATDAARGALVTRLLMSEPTKLDRVQHAVALFRRRGATVEDRRSACIALAGLLEERRDVVRANLGRKDESALFEVANNFAIRHQNAAQKSDYDESFLDWIFWWYLATVELTNRVIERDTKA